MVICLDLDLSAIAVATTTLGINLLNGLFMFYYVKVFLSIYKIDEQWFKYVQATLIGLHLVNEPLIGYVQDYACQWMRNRRRTILVSGPLLCLAYLYPWYNWYDPLHAPSWVPGVHLVTALFAWNVAFPFVNTCVRGFFFDVSRDEGHRVKIVRYNEIANMAATTVLFPIDKLSYSLKNYANFRYCSLAVAFIACVCFVLTGSTGQTPAEANRTSAKKIVNGNDEPKKADEFEEVLAETSEKQPLLTNIHRTSGLSNNERLHVDFDSNNNDPPRYSSVRTAWKVVMEVVSSKNFWLIAGCNFSFWFRTQVMSSFLAIFTEVLVSPSCLPTGSYSIAAYYTLCQMLPRVGLVLSTPISQKFGTYRVIMCSLVLTCLNSACGLLGSAFFSYNVAIAVLLIESILQRFQTMFMVIISDFIEEDTAKHNRKLPASTLIFTLHSSAVKSSISLAPLIVTALINSAGYGHYKSNTRHAPEAFKKSLILVAYLIPAFCSILGFGFFFFYKTFRSREEEARKYSLQHESL